MVEVRALKAGQHIENRFHINAGHTPALADIVAVHPIIANSILTDWLPELPADVTLVSVFYRSLETENDVQLEAPFVTGTVGTHSGADSPNQNTLCISLRSGMSGRSARGRLYWLGLSEDMTSGNVVDATPAAAIVSALQGLQAGLATALYPLTIVSYINNGAPRVGGPVYFEVLSILLVDRQIDSQRRRMPGHGT